MTTTPPASAAELANFIDHTLLKPEASKEDVLTVARQGAQYQVASVCVNPTWVADVARELEGTSVGTCSVVGFPLGATPAANVAYEARRAIEDGASEIDMVVPLGLVKSGEWDQVRDFLGEVRQSTEGTLLKVILETAALTDEEIATLCHTSDEVGADYVKTSTGFHPSGGSTEHAVALMRACVTEATGVKASGGIRDLATALKMISLGATRLGLSGTAAILAELD